jgi:hypothetical protein
MTTPEPARGAALLVTEGGLPSIAVIGDENSPWHAKALWMLPAS